MNGHEKEAVQPSGFNYSDDEIDLREIFSAIWAGKWFVITLSAVFSITSVFYVRSLPDIYKSTAVLAPTESSVGSLTRLSGQFGGLASLAGVNLGGGGSKAAEALEILQSWAFIEEYIQEQKIAPKVFAVKGWNAKTNELIYNTKIYDPHTQNWVREPPEGKQAEPSSWELYQKFSGYLTVSKDKETGFTSLIIEYYSPEVAKTWVDSFVNRVNTKLQARDSKEAEKNIAFLKQQIEKTPLASMQSVFYGLIEEETKKLMLAKGSTEYVFRTVSESRVAEKKSKPKRTLICIASAILGGFLGCVIALMRVLNRQKVI